MGEHKVPQSGDLFESILYPASIITSVLFAIIGVFSFFSDRYTFSFMVRIGILILKGIVVNNGIVLNDHVYHNILGAFNRSRMKLRAGIGGVEYLKVSEIKG